jgi:hypothetical protein
MVFQGVGVYPGRRGTPLWVPCAGLSAIMRLELIQA